MNRLIPAILILTGVGTYFVTGSAAMLYGAENSLTVGGQIVKPSALLLVSLFTLGMSCAAGALWRSGKWVSSTLVFALALTCTSYSAWNVVGFLTSESSGKVKLVEAKNRQEKEITEIQNKQALESRKEMLAWMQKTYTVKAPAADKEKMLERMTTLTEAPLPLRKPDVESIAMDARNEAMSDIMGIDKRTASKLSEVGLAALLVAMELLGPSIGFALWRSKNDFPNESGEFSGPSKGNSQIGKPWKSSRKTKDEALALVRSEFPSRRRQITTAYLAQECRVDRRCALNWLREWEKDGLVTLAERDGERGKPSLYVASVRPQLLKTA